MNATRRGATLMCLINSSARRAADGRGRLTGGGDEETSAAARKRFEMEVVQFRETAAKRTPPPLPRFTYKHTHLPTANA